MTARTWGMAALLTVSLLAVWQGASAQLNEGDPDESLQRLGRRINTFLVSIPKDELDEQFDLLIERSPLRKDYKKLTQLKDSIQRETARYGSFREVEALKLELHGQSLARGVYLYKCQDFPLVFDFTFYRASPGDEWGLIALKFHLDYDTL